jgi:hypothetical protein
MTRIAPFARGLSEAFLGELKSGRFKGLLDAAKQTGLDVQVREHYIDIYAKGRGVLNLREVPTQRAYVAKTHVRFLVGVSLPCALGRNGEYCLFDATHEFVESCLVNLPALIHNTQPYAKREATVEEEIIRASLLGNSPVAFVDRQIQTHGLRSKADLLGVARSGSAGGMVVLAELKVGLDGRIQEMMGKLEEYCQVFAPSGHLRPDMVRAYRTVIAQKQVLGLLPEDVVPPDAGDQVQCLAVLSEYNAKSDLLRRLREAARGSRLSVMLVHLARGQCLLPPAAEWEKLS